MTLTVAYLLLNNLNSGFKEITYLKLTKSKLRVLKFCNGVNHQNILQSFNSIQHFTIFLSIFDLQQILQSAKINQSKSINITNQNN